VTGFKGLKVGLKGLCIALRKSDVTTSLKAGEPKGLAYSNTDSAKKLPGDLLAI
jgi:hypothetical protein